MGCDESKPVVEAEAAEKRARAQEINEQKKIEEELLNKKKKAEEKKEEESKQEITNKEEEEFEEENEETTKIEPNKIKKIVCLRPPDEVLEDDENNKSEDMESYENENIENDLKVEIEEENDVKDNYGMKDDIKTGNLRAGRKHAVEEQEDEKPSQNKNDIGNLRDSNNDNNARETTKSYNFEGSQIRTSVLKYYEGIMKRRTSGELVEGNEFTDCLIETEKKLQEKFKIYVKNYDDEIMTGEFEIEFKKLNLIVTHGLHINKVEKKGKCYCLYHDCIGRSKNYYEAYIVPKIREVNGLCYEPQFIPEFSD